MKEIRLSYFVIAILIGIFLFIYGGIDDSPGAQLIGLITAIVSVIVIIRRISKSNGS